ncbi:MAG TPA: nucleotidyltransferase [Candidatus Krumholzibacteria bacterium]|nr:nucleotidyltransferase [Candidatus Krumholzibacteria bacterium]
MGLEDTLSDWTGPSSDSEQEKQERTERMVRDAVDSHDAFDECDLDIYAKGSYANNTNVRADSDVDIAVECTECVYWDTHEPGAYSGGSPYKGPWTPMRLRSELVAALRAKFGDQVDTSGNVAIQINSSTARVDADVVPCFTFHYHFSETNYREGTKIFPIEGLGIVNYPAQQLEKGREKNVATGHAYKKAVRILKRIENAMAGDDYFRELPSYFVECLAYNWPNSLFNQPSWTALTRAGLFHVWDSLQGDEPNEEADRWLEANDCFYLFHDGQEWSRNDGREYAQAAWNYLELGDA